MISVLVTGANGQLGQCLKDIADNAHNIVWHFKSSNQLDITNENDVNTCAIDLKVEYIINCAAYTAVDRAESEKEKAFLVNAIGAKNLAKACEKVNATLIHISTDFVFSGQNPKPYKEEDATGPINEYGASKLKGEEHVVNILTNHFIIRTSWVYSEHGNNFVKTMMRLAKDHDTLRVIDDQVGTPTYAQDLANVIVKIINDKNTAYGLYHYSNEGKATWYDFAKEIFLIKNSKIKVHPITTEEYPTPAKRPKFSLLDKSKINKKLGIELYNWKDSLKRCITKMNYYD